jgi:hypothetical protein
LFLERGDELTGILKVVEVFEVVVAELRYGSLIHVAWLLEATF